MPLFARSGLSFGCVAVAVAFLAAVAALMARPAKDPFTEEEKSAVSAMMPRMDIRPSGDVDRDFVAMMIPHHQGAIDIAEAELRHGRNERLRRMAQEIIVDQQQEIAAMRLALGDATPALASDRSESADSGLSPRAWASFLAANLCLRRLR